MAPASIPSPIRQTIEIVAAAGPIEGELVLPESSRGIVLFAHGSGSSRHSPRNRYVADQLHQRGLGTLLIDLLTAREEQVDAHTAEIRFDVDLLTDRLLLATDWLSTHRGAWDQPIGYFGASTGAAAALAAAAQRPGIAAIVSRGGRPDLARDALSTVRAPTLLLVGELDYQVIRLNRDAFEQLRRCRDKELEIVAGATHLFEEPGALEEVARLAGSWFARRLHTEPAQPLPEQEQGA